MDAAARLGKPTVGADELSEKHAYTRTLARRSPPYALGPHLDINERLSAGYRAPFVGPQPKSLGNAMTFLPDRSRVIVTALLKRHAERRPDSICAVFEDGDSWTWAQALDEASRAAANLTISGVRRGDPVLIFLPNGKSWLRAWWGATALGSPVVPINTAYQGEMLRHVCQHSGATVGVVASEYCERLEVLDRPLTVLDPDQLNRRRPTVDPCEDVHVWDLQAINYTSGTTGTAKGVLTPHLQPWAAGEHAFSAAIGLTPADRCLLDLPLFHAAAQRVAIAAWSMGSSVAVRTGFAGTDYWSVANDCGATVSVLAGTMANFLIAQAESPCDRKHTVRAVVAAPLVADTPAFRSRFGLELVSTCYGSTETHAPIFLPYGEEPVAGTCGKVAPGVELRIVDEHDRLVPDDEVGELIVRTRLPWMMNIGYHREPDATAKAWRNGWFHTGDAFRRDAQGHYFLVDRLKDALRRRGENISSFEVEREVLAFPGIVEAACVAYPGSLGEDEVKVFVVTADGAEVDCPDLIGFLTRRMPSFMVPRYVERVDSLPKTATMRVKKHLLRQRGNGPETWDRESAESERPRSGPGAHLVSRADQPGRSYHRASEPQTS